MNTKMSVGKASAAFTKTEIFTLGKTCAERIRVRIKKVGNEDVIVENR